MCGAVTEQFPPVVGESSESDQQLGAALGEAASLKRVNPLGLKSFVERAEY